jgi:hypothetical protein
VTNRPATADPAKAYRSGRIAVSQTHSKASNSVGKFIDSTPRRATKEILAP